MPPDPLHQHFQNMLDTTGTAYHYANSMAEAASLIASIVKVSPVANGVIWTAPQVRETMPDLITALSAQGCDPRYPEEPGDVRDQPFGLSVAAQAIAETGSMVLIERTLQDRSVGLMTETHFVVCRDADLAASLDDAAGTLSRAAANGGSYATLVTGASRTADIERTLTVGVQGPAEMHVILIAESD